MSTETYSDEDLIPVTICVLFKLGFHLIAFTLKYVVENVYTDLKGMIQTDRIDFTSYELLDLFDSNHDHLTFHTAVAIEKVFLSLANIYGLDIQSVLRDERLDEMSTDFFHNTVVDRFPRDEADDEEEEFDEKKIASSENLEMYAISMLHCVNFLCYMLCKRTIDFANSWSEDEKFFYCNFMGEDYSQEEHAVALKMLQDLGPILEDHQLDTMDMTDKYKVKKR